MNQNSIKWQDIAVKDADKVSDFYCKVAGWTKEGLSMGDYDDYVMKDREGNVVGGICHARGKNSYLPPAWLLYVSVENLQASLDTCTELGGKVHGEIKKMGPSGEYCLIEDPAGAYIMLTAGDFGY